MRIGKIYLKNISVASETWDSAASISRFLTLQLAMVQRESIPIPFGTARGVLIGRRGSVVRSIQRESGAYNISVQEHEIIISGSEGSRKSARRLFQEIMDKNCSSLVNLPTEYCIGSFYGSVGANRRHVEKSCNVRLYLNYDERTVHISGTVAAVAQAKRMFTIQFETFQRLPVRNSPMYGAFVLHETFESCQFVDPRPDQPMPKYLSSKQHFQLDNSPEMEEFQMPKPWSEEPKPDTKVLFTSSVYLDQLIDQIPSECCGRVSLKLGTQLFDRQLRGFRMGKLNHGSISFSELKEKQMKLHPRFNSIFNEEMAGKFKEMIKTKLGFEFLRCENSVKAQVRQKDLNLVVEVKSDDQLEFFKYDLKKWWISLSMLYPSNLGQQDFILMLEESVEIDHEIQSSVETFMKNFTWDGTTLVSTRDLTSEMYELEYCQGNETQVYRGHFHDLEIEIRVTHCREIDHDHWNLHAYHLIQNNQNSISIQTMMALGNALSLF